MASVQAVLAALSADTTRTPEELLVVALAAAARLPGTASANELEVRSGEAVYVAQGGDMLDLIAHRHYGTVAAVRHIQAANPELAGSGPVLAAGTRVRLPTLATTPEEATRRVEVWD